MPKGPSRTQTRARLLAAAREQQLPTSADVVVIGGGAAGLVCAITAAEADASVVVLELAPECGRTILATGNGRCNFCNSDLSPSRYSHPDFVDIVMGYHPLDDVLGFFDECGLAWVEEDGGRLYPRSLSAASVREVLLARARRAGVLLAPARRVVVVEDTETSVLVGFHEEWPGGEAGAVEAGQVVMAAGGISAQPVEGLGTKVPTAPVLCPIACEPAAPGCKGLLPLLDGRRVRCQATLSRDGSRLAREEGEVLFRDYGISGILAFDLSRQALPGDTVLLDLVPELETGKLHELLRRTGTLDGVLDPTIADALAGTSGADGTIALAKGLVLRVRGTADANHAQVRRGGLAVDDFDHTTLRSIEEPRVLACGEALDVDADCGGFNLAWAWTSGMLAGRSAARA